MWECKCSCGNEKPVIVSRSNLKSGNTKSCGCLAYETMVQNGKNSAKHGMTHSRIYRIHKQMKQRCYLVTKDNYSEYGGRGIRICDEWLGENGFENFYKWAMDNGYTDDLEIDRIDNDGNYEPDNCRWVTNKINMRNRRANRFVDDTPWGRITIAELAERINADYNLLYSQIYYTRHTIEELIRMYKDTRDYDGPKYKHRINKETINGDSNQESETNQCMGEDVTSGSE